MFWWLNKPREAGWSLSRRLMSRIIVISTFITVLVTASVTAHYGYDIPELQQRTVFGLAQDVARDMPYDGTGDEMRETVNTKHAAAATTKATTWLLVMAEMHEPMAR